MKTRYWAALLAIALFVSAKIVYKPKAIISVATSASAPEETAPAPAAVIPPVAAITRGVASSASPVAGGGSTGTDLETRVRAVLLKRDPKAQWRLDLDEQGRPFKIAGGVVPGVLLPGKENNDFLMELESALGFRAPAAFARTEKMTGKFRVVDQQQLFTAPDGSTIPVFASYIRYLGNANDETFLIQNELRAVDPDIQTHALLAASDAMAIAAVGREGYTYEIGSPAAVIYAFQLPHQRALQVVAKKDGESRLILVGEQTHTILQESLLSLR